MAFVKANKYFEDITPSTLVHVGVLIGVGGAAIYETIHPEHEPTPHLPHNMYETYAPDYAGTANFDMNSIGTASQLLHQRGGTALYLPPTVRP